MEKEIVSKLELIPGLYVVTTASINEAYPIVNYYDLHADKFGHIPSQSHSLQLWEQQLLEKSVQSKVLHTK